MKEWLRKKYDGAMHRVKLSVYKLCLALMRKLRIYHKSEILSKANSTEGMRWNDVILIGIKEVYPSNYYYVLYHKPGVAFGSTIVTIDDLITGIADLSVNSWKSATIRTVVEEVVKNANDGHFPAGVSRIGELVLPAYINSDGSPLPWPDPNEYKAVREEIKREFKEKESDIYR